ncbi:MAG: hypothetical protein M1828_004159 [Chrysothrix sp. TS-e1954]|nr:MAG: hypothetical protein M1828_004159 [Chrysothrix sp. TS-e1954]
MASLVSVTIPKDYGYVLLTAASTFALSIWHGNRTSSFRKAAEVPYPFPYYYPPSGDYKAYLNNPDYKTDVDDPKRFERYLWNCAQRAHANFDEHHTNLLGSLLIAGLGYPRTAAALGVAWAGSRVAYAVGYTRKDRTGGKGRMAGAGFWLAEAVLVVMAGKVGFDFIIGT